MSTKKEQRKDEETTSTTASTTTSSSYPSQTQQQQQEEEQRQSFNKAIDETRSSIRRAVDEARSQVPRYTQIVNEFQEQTIQSARQIAENYLDSQKDIINTIQSVWAPQVQKISDALYQYCISPKKVAQSYTMAVSSIADNTIAVSRLVNNTVFSNLDAFKTSIQNTRDNLKELSRIGVNAARTFEQTTRDTATATRSASFSS